MNVPSFSLCRVAMLSLCLGTTLSAAPLGSGFVYQGHLSGDNYPVDGQFELTFGLFETDTGGTAVVITTNTVAVSSNGVFMTTLDFGADIFNGSAYWLELGVRGAPDQDFTLLSPRQALNAAPYALWALRARTVETLPPLGTPGFQPLELFVHGGRAFRLEPTTNLDTVNVIGGSFLNIVDSGVVGATIAGGGSGDDPVLGGASPNMALSHYASIGGGSGNSVSGVLGAIGGGWWNLIEWPADYATISGGASNRVTEQYGSVVGGNFNLAGAFAASVLGGMGNRAMAFSSAVGGGKENSILDADYGTIAGGLNNTLGAFVNDGFAHYSAIGGGLGNLIRGSRRSTIGGGENNQITEGGFAGNLGVTISGGMGNAIRGGSLATIGGGEGNRISGLCVGGTIAGGGFNNNDGAWGTIAGGSDNFIAGDCDFGFGNWYATIGGGFNNSIGFRFSGISGSIIGGGFYNEIDYVNLNGSAGTIGGGMSNRVERTAGTIPGGSQAKVSNHGQMAYASGQFEAAGDAQTSTYVCRNSTTNNLLTELFLDGMSERMVLPENSTWGFDILVTGRAANGDSAVYQIRGAIKNNAGTTILIRSPNATRLGSDDPSWDAVAAADNVNDALVVKVSGADATMIRWVASVRTVEVSH